KRLVAGAYSRVFGLRGSPAIAENARTTSENPPNFIFTRNLQAANSSYNFRHTLRRGCIGEPENTHRLRVCVVVPSDAFKTIGGSWQFAATFALTQPNRALPTQFEVLR